jgi:excisionase family DNA binding protein
MTIHETTQSERWLTLEEAAAHLNVSLSWIYQKGAKQGLPLCQIGRQYRVRATDLDKWLLENGVKSA